MENAYLNMQKSYYPFGSLMPGRSFATDKYRFGFNGMENATDIAEGNYTTPFRELDTRLGGRWWSKDPIVKPWESPYAGFSNNPIVFSDPSGLDPITGDDNDPKHPDNINNVPDDGQFKNRDKDGNIIDENKEIFTDEVVRTSDDVKPIEISEVKSNSNTIETYEKVSGVLNDVKQKGSKFLTLATAIASGYFRRVAGNNYTAIDPLAIPLDIAIDAASYQYIESLPKDVAISYTVGSLLGDIFTLHQGLSEIGSGSAGEVVTLGGSTLFVVHGVSVASVSGKSIVVDLKLLEKIWNSQSQVNFGSTGSINGGAESYPGKAMKGELHKVKQGKIQSHDTWRGINPKTGKPQHPDWIGAEEYRVGPAGQGWRIFKQTLENGTSRYGWSKNHYIDVKEF